MDWKQSLLISSLVAIAVVSTVAIYSYNQQPATASMSESDYVTEGLFRPRRDFDGDEKPQDDWRKSDDESNQDGGLFFRREKRPRLFDGSRMKEIGIGCFWCAGGIVAVSLAISFGIGQIKKQTGI